MKEIEYHDRIKALTNVFYIFDLVKRYSNDTELGYAIRLYIKNIKEGINQNKENEV